MLSLVVRGCLVGMFILYEEVGGWMFGGKLVLEKYRNMLFFVGVIVGLYFLLYGVFKFGEVMDVVVSFLSVVVGGFLMILGLRMVGGCIFGYGILGILLLLMLSFLMVGVMFVVGGLMGLLIG